MTGRHGLVIGKFYPPHAGHHLLVRAAAAACTRVTVVVMASRAETIPLATRVAWMREVHTEPGVTITGIHDELAIDFHSDAIWAGHVALMREAIAAVTDQPVDAVFTSEAYGDELGRRLGARHVAIDPVRTLAPVSGTAVRADPVATWDQLAPCVRAGLAWRLVIVGAESTGKTTLAAALTDRLRRRPGLGLTRWVAEVGRDYTIDKLAAARATAAVAGDPPPALESLRWTSDDFVAVARDQVRREADAARHGGPVLVCDTDAVATGVWHQRYLGARSAEVEAVAAPAPHHLYLLTHPADVPFHQDGVRDGEAIRDWMTEVFAAHLDERGCRWQWLRGDRDQRLAAAEAAVDAWLAAGWGLAPPLGSGPGASHPEPELP
jgi:NadR type nicotinamide-nucleotide adenylyltransferase